MKPPVKIAIPFFVFCFCAMSFFISAQTGDENREVFLRVFSNYKYGIKEEDPQTGFEIRRVYIGCRGSLNQVLNAEVKLDIGSPDDLSQFSLSRRYAYFKTAVLIYNKEQLTAWFGLFDMQQFKVQEDFWGYRYIFKSFQDENKFGPSADMGAGLKYEFSRYIAADIILSNGEGYRNFEYSDFIKYGAGITIKPFSNYVFRIYSDLIQNISDQSTLVLFSGYSQSRYKVGGEFIYRMNHRFIESHKLKGYSFFGTWIFNPDWELFLRYDRLNSNIIPGQELPWNLYNDGTSIITGIQFCPLKDLKISLNYQDKYSLARNGPDRAYIFMNFQFDLN